MYADHDAFKTPAQLILCCDCFQPMNSIYDRSIRTTCSECGGVSLYDSHNALLNRRREKAEKRRAESETSIQATQS